MIVDHLSEREREKWRKQALDWLRAELEARRRTLAKRTAKAGPLLAKTLQHWLADADFMGVRGEEALARLPSSERESWRKLWGDVADTLAASQK